MYITQFNPIPQPHPEMKFREKLEVKDQVNFKNKGPQYGLHMLLGNICVICKNRTALYFDY